MNTLTKIYVDLVLKEGQLRDEAYEESQYAVSRRVEFPESSDKASDRSDALYREARVIDSLAAVLVPHLSEEEWTAAWEVIKDNK